MDDDDPLPTNTQQKINNLILLTFKTDRYYGV